MKNIEFSTCVAITSAVALWSFGLPTTYVASVALAMYPTNYVLDKHIDETTIGSLRKTLSVALLAGLVGSSFFLLFIILFTFL